MQQMRNRETSSTEPSVKTIHEMSSFHLSSCCKTICQIFNTTSPLFCDYDFTSGLLEDSKGESGVSWNSIENREKKEFIGNDL